jgi:hypothetical protein
MLAERQTALDELYAGIDQLREKLGGPRLLEDATGASGWPQDGIYLFFEEGEVRSDGRTPRVVRVGTPPLTASSRTALWQRLSQHRGQVAGTNPGGGDHRGSSFRHHVGTALLNRADWGDAGRSWGRGVSSTPEVRAQEVRLEMAVSQVIRGMPLLWLEVPEPTDRSAIHRDLIALLSNVGREPLDPPSAGWLGASAESPAIRGSGLWNVDHVDEQPDGAGLARFVELVDGLA